jgi:predicted NAD/FAD-dependent oxidoreductase
MLSKVKSLIEIENPSHITLHAWRFANIQKQKSELFFVDNDQQLSACGDWCIQGRVESAFISAFKLAQHIIGAINE